MTEYRPGCVACGAPVDMTRGSQSKAGRWAHQTCIRIWAAAVIGDVGAARAILLEPDQAEAPS